VGTCSTEQMQTTSVQGSRQEATKTSFKEPRWTRCSQEGVNRRHNAAKTFLKLSQQSLPWQFNPVRLRRMRASLPARDRSQTQRGSNPPPLVTSEPPLHAADLVHVESI
jgi:hypothetical protein